MKKLTISLCILGFALTAKAQVGVNTTNPQATFHVDAKGDNATTGTPTATQQANDVVVEKETGNVGIGTTTPNAKLDVRPNPTSISNPGAGIIGIGTTTIAASTAGAGAVRYDTASGGVLEYSNGIVWNTLTSTVKKSLVSARLAENAYTFKSAAAIAETVNNWTEEVDVNGDFDPTTGIFTVPRDGNYFVSCTLLPVAYTSTGGQMEAKVRVNGVAKAATVIGTANGTYSYWGVIVTSTISAKAGDKITIVYFSDFGKSNRSSYGDTFNLLSIAEY